MKNFDNSVSFILSSQVVSLPLQSVIHKVAIANFCAAMDSLIDQDVYPLKFFFINFPYFIAPHCYIPPSSGLLR